MKLLITGATGQLGSALREQLGGHERHTALFMDRSALDLSDPASVQRLGDIDFDLLINTAAYTAVDKAEQEQDKAFRINAEAIGEMGVICAARGIPVIHYSSDYVYDNGLDRPLRETDPVQPRGVYARSKWQGEELLRQSQPQHLILRTSWVFAHSGHNFVRTMLRLGRERSEVTVVADQWGAPTYATDLAAATLQLADRLADGASSAIYGTYNYAGAGMTNWADYASCIFSLAGISCKVLPTTTEVYNAPAPRPLYSLMDLSAIGTLLPDPLPHWQDALRRCLTRLGEQI